MFDVVSNIYFDVNRYVTDDLSVGEARRCMYDDILKQIKILLKNRCIAVIKELDDDLISIEYNFNNDIVTENSVNPYWLKEEEYNSIINKEKEIEDFYNKLP